VAGNDFGIKVTLPGADIATASDAQLLFSSSWPNLKIYKNLTFSGVTVDSTGSSANLAHLYTHGLGFVPAVIPYVHPSNSPGDGASINRANIVADKQNIYYLTQGPGPLSLSVRLSILYLDIETPFTAPVINTGNSGAATPDSNYGLKLSKPNKDVKSSDLRDFILHSSSRSPMVHAVVPGYIPASSTGDSTFSYTHDLPYAPMFFAFVQQAVPVVPTSPYLLVNGYAGLSTSGNTINITGVSTSKVSIIILKDPFTITDNVINVSL
jgi:hypothetical protein